MLAARPNLESEFRGTKVLTVFVTEEGKIDRSYVLDDAGEIMWGDFAFPAVLTRETPTGIIPELLSKRWEPLGLTPEQLGHMGLTIFDNKNNPGADSIYMLYAWPRRPASPLAGSVLTTLLDGPTALPSHTPTRWLSWSTICPARSVTTAGRRTGSPGCCCLRKPRSSAAATSRRPGSGRVSSWTRRTPGKNIGLVLTMANKVIIGWLEPVQSGNSLKSCFGPSVQRCIFRKCKSGSITSVCDSDLYSRASGVKHPFNRVEKHRRSHAVTFSSGSAVHRSLTSVHS